MVNFQEFPSPEVLECGQVSITRVIGSTSGFPTASSAFPNTTDITGINILVTGTFTVDQDIVFTNCNVYFSENAEMVTQGTVDLVGISSRFVYCEDKAWRRIRINAEGALRFDDCVVAGALDGLDFRRGYRAQNSFLQNNRFFRNRYSISCVESGTKLSFTTFIHNTFYGIDPVPGLGTKPISGIHLVTCNAVIGTTVIYADDDPFGYDGFVNTFRNFHFGIESYNSTLYLTNCRFEQMRPEATVKGELTGCGVNAIGGSLTVSALPIYFKVFGHCEFRACAAAGIRASNCRLNISRAKFSGEQVFGISSRFTGFKAQNIEWNNFDIGGYPICKAGVFLERPNGSGEKYSTTIHHNRLNLYSAQGDVSGIDIRCPNASTDFMSINDNSLELNGSSNLCYGIIIFGGRSSNIEIIKDTINHINQSGKSFGIFLANFEGVGHLLQDNNSYGRAQCNYHLEKSRNVRYCGNTSNLASNGFHFFGDNDKAFWSLNNIGGHTEGLFVADIPNSDPMNPPLSSGRISAQIRKGNLWNTDESVYFSDAAKCDADPSNSMFLIEQQIPGLFPTKVSPASGWFVLEEGDPEACSSYTNKTTSRFEQRLALDDFPPGLLSDAEEWEAIRLLMETIIRYPDMLVSEPELQPFYYEHLNTSAGQFAQINLLLENNNYAPGVQWADLENVENQARSIKHDIDMQNAFAVTPNFSQWYNNPGNPLLPATLDAWFAATENLGAIDNDLRNEYSGPLAQALQDLESIPVSLPYEQAYKTLKSYEIKIAQGLDMAAAGYADILALSGKDEAIYGGAVRQARHYLSECDRYEQVAPHENIEALRHEASSYPNLTSGIQIQPNPANDVVQVSRKSTESGQWHLYSVSGKLIRSGNWEADQNTLHIDTHDIAPGAYYITAHFDSGVIESGKVVILH